VDEREERERAEEVAVDPLPDRSDDDDSDDRV
jgi:hypothetical protein